MGGSPLNHIPLRAQSPVSTRPRKQETQSRISLAEPSRITLDMRLQASARGRSSILGRKSADLKRRPSLVPQLCWWRWNRAGEMSLCPSSSPHAAWLHAVAFWEPRKITARTYYKVFVLDVLRLFPSHNSAGPAVCFCGVSSFLTHFVFEGPAFVCSPNHGGHGAGLFDIKRGPVVDLHECGIKSPHFFVVAYLPAYRRRAPSGPKRDIGPHPRVHGASAVFTPDATKCSPT